jgi:hypothetical protein
VTERHRQWGDAAVAVDQAVEQGPLLTRLLWGVADDDEAAWQALDGGRANARAGVAGYNHLLKRRLAVCCSCSKSAAKSPALVAAFADPPRSTDRPRRTAHTPDSLVLSGRDQAPPNPLIENPQPAHSCRRRDSTMRLWQLRDCYVELARLPAAFGQADTPWSMGAASLSRRPRESGGPRL